MTGFLSSMQQLIETFPGAGAYSCCFESVEKDGSRRSHHAMQSELQSSRCALIKDYFESAMRSYLITSSSVVIPKQVFEKVGAFNPAIRRGEDRDMWRRIALEYPMAYLNEAQAVVYADAQNRACDRAFHLSESAVASAEEVLWQAKKDGKASPSYEEYMIKLIIVKAELLIAENRCREARELLLRYHYTKRNKKALLRAWLLSFAPQRFRRRGGRAACTSTSSPFTGPSITAQCCRPMPSTAAPPTWRLRAAGSLSSTTKTAISINSIHSCLPARAPARLLAAAAALPINAILAREKEASLQYLRGIVGD